jgi:glycosyltransferase involved in cell wall biosynthesis
MSRAAAIAWAAALGTVLHDRRVTPMLVPRPGAPPSPVTAIVPARDEEAAIEATLRALAGQAAQVVAVDDQSRDGTRAAMARVPGIEVIDGAPPPAGWTGKAWACHQAVARATSPWLLFVDADVRLLDGTVAALLAFAADRGARGATVFPFLETGSVAERAVLPLAGALMETAVIPGWAARAAWTDVAIGVGGCLLVERAFYEALGGHEAVRGEVVDDLALARAAKRAGHLLPWARGDHAVRLRYYTGARDMWQGWRKNASHAWGGSIPAAMAGGALVQWAVLAPWWALARRRRSGAAGVALQAATLLEVLRATDIPRPYALAAPAAAAFVGAVGLQAVLDRLSGRATWRGRPLAG